MRREISPIKGQMPDPNKIACKDCVYRNRDKITVNNRTIYVGVTKGFCDIYKRPQYAGKPNDILFMNADCEFYIKDPHYES